MLFVPLYKTSPTPFQHHTLILPCISIGNVGQMSIDLLASNEFLKVGYIESPYVLPICGNDSVLVENNKNGDISINLEVFQRPNTSVTIIQQRAPVSKRYKQMFANELIIWAKNNNFKEIILLKSTNAIHRVDNQLFGSQLRFLEVNLFDQNTLQSLKAKGWQELESNSIEYTIEKGSLTEKICNESTSKEISLLVLTIFCTEGNNMPEAFAMADYLNQYLNIHEGQWKVPISWMAIEGKVLDLASCRDMF